MNSNETIDLNLNQKLIIVDALMSLLNHFNLVCKYDDKKHELTVYASDNEMSLLAVYNIDNYSFQDLLKVNAIIRGGY